MIPILVLASLGIAAICGLVVAGALGALGRLAGDVDDQLMPCDTDPWPDWGPHWPDVEPAHDGVPFHG